jgi:hypothetical protein
MMASAQTPTALYLLLHVQGLIMKLVGRVVHAAAPASLLPCMASIIPTTQRRRSPGVAVLPLLLFAAVSVETGPRCVCY